MHALSTTSQKYTNLFIKISAWASLARWGPYESMRCWFLPVHPPRTVFHEAERLVQRGRGKLTQLSRPLQQASASAPGRCGHDSSHHSFLYRRYRHRHCRSNHSSVRSNLAALRWPATRDCPSCGAWCGVACVGRPGPDGWGSVVQWSPNQPAWTVAQGCCKKVLLLIRRRRRCSPGWTWWRTPSAPAAGPL